MKKITGVILFAALLVTGCSKTEDKTSVDKKETKSEQTAGNNNNNVEVVEIKIPTVQCGTCKMNLTKAFKRVDGINSYDISIDNKIVKINYDKSKTDLDKIEGAIVMAGYQANDKPANKESYDKLQACCKIGGHDK